MPKEWKCPLCKRLCDYSFLDEETGELQFYHDFREYKKALVDKQLHPFKICHKFIVIWDNDSGWGLVRGKASEIVRVYETRIDCCIAPGRARRQQGIKKLERAVMARETKEQFYE